MAKSLALTDSKKIVVMEGLYIDRKDMRPITNKAGVKMLKYKYQWIKTKNSEYRIGDPQSYSRIAKALNSPNIRFVKIDNDLVNIATIEIIKEKTGCISLEKP